MHQRLPDNRPQHQHTRTPHPPTLHVKTSQRRTCSHGVYCRDAAPNAARQVSLAWLSAHGTTLYSAEAMRMNETRTHQQTDDGKSYTEPSAIISGKVEGREDVLCRVHDACFTSGTIYGVDCCTPVASTRGSMPLSCCCCCRFAYATAVSITIITTTIIVVAQRSWARSSATAASN